MQRYIVAYDIANDKNRRKIGEALEAFGRRVNYSVFEIQIKTKVQKNALEEELLRLLSPKNDSLRFYHICANCIEKSWSLGDEPPPFEQNTVYFL